MGNLYDEILNIIYSTYWDYSLKPVGYRSLDSELVSSINLIARDKALFMSFQRIAWLLALVGFEFAT